MGTNFGTIQMDFSLGLFWKLLKGTLFCEPLSELSKRNSIWDFFGNY